MADKIFGNDRSHWNGKSNFAIAYANGARFDITKSSEGFDYLDDTFVANWSGAEAQYKVHGAYHFFRPGHNISAQLVNLQKGLAQVDFHERAILAIDVEANDGLANSVTSIRLKTFCKKVREMYPKNPMMIYTSPYYWGLIGSADKYWLNFGLWEANTQVKTPTPIKPWNDDWAIWQFSHTGHGPSYGAGSPNIDVNIMAQWYWDALKKDEQPQPEPQPQPTPTMPEVITSLTINGVNYAGEMRKQ